MADAKTRHALMTYFGNKYELRARRAFVINRNVEKWAANDILDSYGYARSRVLIDRYFEVYDNPTWKDFRYNVQKVFDAMETSEEDKRTRQKLQAQAQEWIQKYG